MTPILIQGRTFDLSLEASVRWITWVIISPLQIVEGIYWALTFAMPGSYKSYFSIIDESIKQQKENLTVVDEYSVLKILNEFLPLLEAFVAIAREISEWQNNNVPKKTRTAHYKFVREHGPKNPPWCENEDYKAKLQKLSSIFKLYLTALSQTIPLIQETLPPGTVFSVSDELDRTLKLIPYYQMILEHGYWEAMRKKAEEFGYASDQESV